MKHRPPPAPASPGRTPPQAGEEKQTAASPRTSSISPRALRAAGIPVGPGAVLDALEAVQAAGVGTREDFYWTLHAVFVKRHEHSVLFDQAFRIFFRRRGYIDQMLAMMLPQAPAEPQPPQPPQPGATRVHEALFSGLDDKLKKEREVELDARMTVSDREVLQHKDFAQMTSAEIAAAKEAMKRLVLPLAEVRTRRLKPHPRGHLIDIRRTLRASMKGGGDFIDLRFIGPKTKPPPLVALLDISGSMSQYSRIFLHFLHALTDARKRVSTFLVRHAADQRHPCAARARSRRCARRLLGERARLVGRHAHRLVAARLQQAVGAPRAHAGRDRAARSPTGSSAMPTIRSPSRSTGCTAPAGDWSGSIRCCASRVSRRAPAASAPCCRTSTSSARSIISNSMAALVAALERGGDRAGDPKAWMQKVA